MSCVCYSKEDPQKEEKDQENSEKEIKKNNNGHQEVEGKNGFCTRLILFLIQSNNLLEPRCIKKIIAPLGHL